MKRLLILFVLTVCIQQIRAQTTSKLHHGEFKKVKFAASSRPYKLDSWEKPYFDSAFKSVFPSDLKKSPDKYKGKLIHLVGIVDSVYADDNDATTLHFVLENKYWDYIEDYSVQDEIMFVSSAGEGKFMVTLSGLNPQEVESCKSFADEKKLFLVYGNFEDVKNDMPILDAQQVKYIDYKFYSTTIFYYEIVRDANGNVQVKQRGMADTQNFKFLKVAKPGQNK